MYVVSETECQKLHEQVFGLNRRVEEDSTSHSRDLRQLQDQLEARDAHYAELEGALQRCRVELQGHVTRVEQDSTQHTTQMWQMKRQV